MSAAVLARVTRCVVTAAVAAAAYCAGSASWSAPAQANHADVVAVHRIEFPRDEGSHPQFRTEWWYLTGWLRTPDGDPLGFQITFFRSRPGIDEGNPSRFAAASSIDSKI